MKRKIFVLVAIALAAINCNAQFISDIWVNAKVGTYNTVGEIGTNDAVRLIDGIKFNGLSTDINVNKTFKQVFDVGLGYAFSKSEVNDSTGTNSSRGLTVESKSNFVYSFIAFDMLNGFSEKEKLLGILFSLQLGYNFTSHEFGYLGSADNYNKIKENPFHIFEENTNGLMITPGLSARIKIDKISASCGMNLGFPLSHELEGFSSQYGKDKKDFATSYFVMFGYKIK